MRLSLFLYVKKNMQMSPTLGTWMPACADSGLNLDDKDQFLAVPF
jgi:hypothetical protein